MPNPSLQKSPLVSLQLGTRQENNQLAMVRFEYVYWCVSHQQYVKPRVRRKLQNQLRCKILRLNLTLMQQVDLNTLSTWIDSEHSTRKRA